MDRANNIFDQIDTDKSGGLDKVLLVWDAVAGGKPLLKLKIEGWVKALTWYGEGDARRIVSGGEKLLLWDAVKGGAPLLKLEGHTSWVNAIACHGEGDARRAVSGGGDKTLLVMFGAPWCSHCKTLAVSCSPLLPVPLLARLTAFVSCTMMCVRALSSLLPRTACLGGAGGAVRGLKDAPRWICGLLS